MILFLLHESTTPHVHASPAALSLAEYALAAMVVGLTAYVFLRALRRTVHPSRG